MSYPQQPIACIFSFLLLFSCLNGYGQEVVQDLAPKEKEIIQFRAIAVLHEFNNLLNQLAQETEPVSSALMIDGAIRGKARMFKDEKSLFDYDLDPAHKDVDTRLQTGPVGQYLSDFDLLYAKNSGPIIFSDLAISEIKESEAYGYHVLVKYQSHFQGKKKTRNEVDRYLPTQKLAYLSVEKDQTGNNWRVFIQHVFFQPANDTILYSKVLSDEALNKLFQEKLALAHQYYQLFEYDQALTYYREADQLIPTDSINNIVRELFVNLQIIDARSIYTISQYSNLLVRDSENPDLYFERGVNYLRQAMFDLAGEDLLQAISLAPTYLKAHLVYTLLNIRQENQATAIQYLTSAKELHIGENKLLDMASIELENSRFQSAEKFILEALDWDTLTGRLSQAMPESISVPVVERQMKDEDLGNEAFEREEWTQADLFFRKALIDQPNNEVLLLKSGQCQLMLDNNESAYRIAKELVSEHKGLAEAYLLLGKACLNMELYRDAKKAFKQAVKLNPDMKEAHLALANYYRDMEDDQDRAALHEELARQ